MAQEVAYELVPANGPAVVLDYGTMPLEEAERSHAADQERQAVLDRRFKYQAWSACAITACLAVVILLAIGVGDWVESAQAHHDTQPFKAVEHSFKPSELWGSIGPPYPTGAWWTNLVLGNGDQPVAVTPYVVKADDSGLHVSYSAKRRMITATSVKDYFADDIVFAADTTVAKRHVDSFDALSVSYRFKLMSSDDEPALMVAPLVRGSPYVTVEYQGGALPVIRSEWNIDTITSWSDHTPALDPRCSSHAQCAAVGLSGNCCPTAAGKTLWCCSQGAVSGDTFEIQLANKQTWLLFASTNMTFGWTSTEMMAQQREQHSADPIVLRLALLPHLSSTSSASSSEHAHLLAKHKRTYPIGGAVSWAVKKSDVASVATEVGEVVLRWKTATTSDDGGVSVDHGGLLMMALHHHLEVMDASPTSLSLRCTKGTAQAVVGTQWTLRYPLSAITWHSPTASSQTERSLHHADNLTSAIRAQAQHDIHLTPPTAPDVYGFGKQLARLARLTLILERVGDPAGALAAVAVLRSALVPWMTDDWLVYDSTWGGIVTKTGLDDKSADFGNGWYDDHHFHYGYLMYGIAVACRMDPAFAEQYRNHFHALAMDVVNPDSSESVFPVARHKDFFDGHSWASGLFEQANSKSQESSSEAVNCYYAAALYAQAVENKELEDFARTLLAMELHSARWYWHVPSSNPVYDQNFKSKNKMVGVVGATEVVASTWFGSSVEFVHCINMIPITPITEDLLPKEFVEEEFPALARALRRWEDPIAVQWRGFVVQDMAILDARSAWNMTLRLADDPTDAVDSGNSYANMLDWAATRPDFAESRGTLWSLFVNTSTSTRTPSALPSAEDDAPTSPTCADHPGCAALALIGDCCPTPNGLSLECC